ncbi:MAG: AraC family transcriptional regulator [Pseudomonadota bacterium]
MVRNSLPVRVVPVSQLVAKGRWRAEALHADPAHMMIWFTKGQGGIVLAGMRANYVPNTVVFLPANIPHAFEARPGTFGSVAYIENHSTLEMPEHPILYRVRDLIAHGEFVNLFETMQKEAAREAAPAQDRACRFHAGIMGVWLERQENQLRDGGALSASERLSRRYATLLEERYASGANVKTMASELGVTPTHLTRACQSAAGVSAHQLLSERLMYEARARLARTKTPVSRIAKELGFSSPAYFTRAFQKATGTTPSAFRESQ